MRFIKSIHTKSYELTLNYHPEIDMYVCIGISECHSVELSFSGNHSPNEMFKLVEEQLCQQTLSMLM
jgi:hypothetical protein